MRVTTFSALAAVCLSVIVAAQQPAAPPAQGARGGGAGGRIGGNGIGAYPSRAADPAAVERGRGVYGTNCAFCHGQDIRGGDGGPSLLRSALVLDDQNGELIGPVVQTGRPDRGMPKFALGNDQISDVAAFLHSFRVAGYDSSRNQPPTIVVGDAAAGQAYFAARCAACHSTAGDLAGIASRYENPRQLQQQWLMPGSIAGRGVPMPPNAKPPRARVTPASGAPVEGELERLDDFSVAIRRDDGSRASWRIVDGKPRVEVIDPLKPHRDMLRGYSDADIHDVTAYLVTLK
jgi:cytochrome c oxidase cbb3-type subunit III